ncbi:MAG: hypothetical protein V3V75_05660, partial [Thermoguttaceae bacterium]
MWKWSTTCLTLTIVACFMLATVALTGCTKPEKTTPDEVEGAEKEVVKEPVPEESTPEGPKLGEPKLEEPPPEEPIPEEPTPEAPTPEEPTPEEPKPNDTSSLKKAELLVELPWEYNTPDGMCLLPNGEIIVAVPNVNSFLAQEDKSKQDPPPVLLKITKEGKAVKWYDPPKHPLTGNAFPFGICIDPEGKNFYLTDLQFFSNMENPGNNSRVLRIPLDENYNPAGDPVVVVEGLVVANAVIIRDGHLYVTDTTMVPGSEPLVSGVFRVNLAEEEGLKLTQPIEKDPHMIGSIITKNADIGFGADGLTFDSQGNLYIGNFADGTLHKFEFDADGKVKSNTIFVQDEKMRCCDGL